MMRIFWLALALLLGISSAHAYIVPLGPGGKVPIPGSGDLPKTDPLPPGKIGPFVDKLQFNGPEYRFNVKEKREIIVKVTVQDNGGNGNVSDVRLLEDKPSGEQDKVLQTEPVSGKKTFEFRSKDVLEPNKDYIVHLINMSTEGGTPTATVNLVVTPIPAAVWLFGSALLGLLGVMRRRPLFDFMRGRLRGRKTEALPAPA